jgi:hypothetical protein
MPSLARNTVGFSQNTVKNYWKYPVRAFYRVIWEHLLMIAGKGRDTGLSP